MWVERISIQKGTEPMLNHTAALVNFSELRLQAAEARYLASTFASGEAAADLPAHASALEVDEGLDGAQS
jgi:hypothetical protein